MTDSYGEFSDNTIHGTHGGPAIDAEHDPNLIDVTIARNHIYSTDDSIICKCDFSYITDNTIEDIRLSHIAMGVNGNTTEIRRNTTNAAAIYAVLPGGTIDGNTLDGGGGNNALLVIGGLQLTISNNSFSNANNVALLIGDNAPVSSTSATVTRNTFDSVATGIELHVANAGYTVDVTIGGSPDDANVFTNSGDTSVQALAPGQLLYLVGVTQPINAEYNDWGRCNDAAIENVIYHHPDDASLGTVDYDPFISPASCTTPTPTPSPTASSSPSPTPSATTTPHIQGDLNCDGHVDGGDALAALRKGAGIPLVQPLGCDALGTGTPKFGDATCDGAVNLLDALVILQYAGGVTIDPEQPASCTPPGDPLPV